jgi:hypothetical protein
MATRALCWAGVVFVLVVIATAQPPDKMAKYYKRTGQKFLDEKAKVRVSASVPAQEERNEGIQRSLVEASDAAMRHRCMPPNPCMQPCFSRRARADETEI